MIAYTAWHQRYLAVVLVRDVNEALGFKDRNKEVWIRRWLAVLKKKIQYISSPFSKVTRTPTGLMEDGTQGTKPLAPRKKQKASIGIQGLQSNMENDECDQSDSASAQAPPTHKHCWTMTHGFYAVMGGFAIDTSSEGPSFVHGRQDRLTFTVEGLRFIALNNQDLLPDIPEREIQDKSKANGLAKFLVCIQALWFCVQCISRIAQGLPISLLEVNTAAHAICTLLIYLLWWSKPLDVEEPTLLKGPMSWTLAAWMWMTGIETEEQYWTPYETDVTFEDPTVSGQGPPAVDLGVDRETFQISPRCSHPGDHELMTLQPSFVPDESAGASNTTITNVYGGRLTDILRYRRFYNPKDIQNLRSPIMVYKRWNLINRGTYPQTRSLGQYWYGGQMITLLRLGNLKWQPRIGSFRHHVETPVVVRVNWAGVKLYKSVAIQIQQRPEVFSDRMQGIVRRATNWPLTLIDLFKFPKKQQMIALFLSGFLYGGFHALAWDYYFISEVQRRLWQVSAITIMAAAPFTAFGLRLTAKLHKRLVYTIERHFSHSHAYNAASVGFKNLIFLTMRLLGISFYCAGSLYLAGRVYLVVESFVNVMNLPESVYQLPVWSAYFPHIS
ncbi:hypothetical protein MMC27_006797 [Xylographa pallens]|nr:hypothetical protein [Xylographa pallens]